MPPRTMIGGEYNKSIPFHAKFAHLINQRPHTVIQPQCERFIVRKTGGPITP